MDFNNIKPGGTNGPGGKEKLRRSGLKITASLIVLLGSLFYVMILAVINGSAGFIAAMGVTVSGALGIAKSLGEPVALSYNGIIAICIFCGVLRGALRYLEQYSNHYIAFRLLAVIRDKIFGALRRLCPAKLESREKGDIIAMITSDIETLEVFYAHTISPVCIAVVVSLAVAVFTAIASDVRLALVAVLSYIVVGVIVPAISSGSLNEHGVKYRKTFASFSSFFLDSIKGIGDIVLDGAGEARKAEVGERSKILLGETAKMKRETAKASAFTELIVSLAIIVTLITGIALVYGGSLSVGRMIIGVVAVFSSFGPVIAISALPGNLTQTFAAGDRVLDLLAEEPVVAPVVNGSALAFDALEVSGLDFAYEAAGTAGACGSGSGFGSGGSCNLDSGAVSPGSCASGGSCTSGGPDPRILKNIAMNARRGEIVGIVGESGCGKSTLLKLLLRFWQKDAGTISYSAAKAGCVCGAGLDIDLIDGDSLLDNVTMVSQNTYLFDETIADNLRIAKPDATQAELEDACRKASIHDFINSLSEGYNTKVGALGDKLSAGEKQRIGLARAFLRGAGLILLDEPTSNVDSINEGIILKALKEQRADRSIILVSHRESTMAIADRIYRIENGRIHEEKLNGGKKHEN